MDDNASGKSPSMIGADSSLPSNSASGASATAASVEDSSSSTAAPAGSEQSMMLKVITLTKDKDVKVVQKAAIAAGHICAGHAAKGNLEPALEGLFALGFNKNEDVLFTVGEALCFVFGGGVLFHCLHSMLMT